MMDKIDSNAAPKVIPASVQPGSTQPGSATNVSASGKTANAKSASNAISVERASASITNQKTSSLPTLPSPSSKILPTTYESTVQRVDKVIPQAKADLSTILELLTMIDTQLYTSQRIAASSQLTSQLQAMESKKKSLKREATSELAAGIIRGAFEIGSAALNFAGSVKMGRLIRNNPNASDMNLNALTMRLSLVTSGLSQGISAAGTMGSSIAAYVGQEEKAEQVGYDEQATKAQSMQEALGQSAQQAMSTFDNINNILRSVTDTRHEVAEKAYY